MCDLFSQRTREMLRKISSVPVFCFSTSTPAPDWNAYCSHLRHKFFHPDNHAAHPIRRSRDLYSHILLQYVPLPPGKGLTMSGQFLLGCLCLQTASLPVYT